MAAVLLKCKENGAAAPHLTSVDVWALSWVFLVIENPEGL